MAGDRRSWHALACIAVFASVPIDSAVTLGAVDLELRADTPIAPLGGIVAVGLFAVSDDGSNQNFSGLDVVLTWDETDIELIDAVDDGPHSWSFIFGFRSDTALDGLNDSFQDGDALFQAASFGAAAATPEGLRVATFRFTALAYTRSAHVVIEPSLGDYSRTQVLEPGGVDVTGSLGWASVTVVETSLRAQDTMMPAGRTAHVAVRGTITGQSTFGVSLLVEIVPRPGNIGQVTYSEAPPVDIEQGMDPWPGAGTFSPYDTASPGFSGTLNGSVDDDGEYLGSPLSFIGLLASFPVRSSADASGVWDVILETSVGNSSWEGVATSLQHGTVRIVAFADGDGNGAIDVRDFYEFQTCYTGADDPVSPPAYSLAPELRCIVYDFDDDGDIDDFDYVRFWEAMSGPLPDGI